MNLKISLLLFFLSVTLLKAQTDSLNTGPWTPSGVAGANLSQIALNNWTQGGENALSFTIFGNFGLKYESNPWTLTNNLIPSFRHQIFSIRDM